MPKRILTLWNEEKLNEADTRILRTPCTETPYPFDKATKEAVRAGAPVRVTPWHTSCMVEGTMAHA